MAGEGDPAKDAAKDEHEQPLGPADTDAELGAQLEPVKIIVDRFERGIALFALRGRHVNTGGHRTVLTFDGTELCWAKGQWNEDHSQAAVLCTPGQVLVELERAKRTAPFQCEAARIIVEWKSFLT